MITNQREIPALDCQKEQFLARVLIRHWQSRRWWPDSEHKAYIPVVFSFQRIDGHTYSPAE